MRRVAIMGILALAVAAVAGAKEEAPAKKATGLEEFSWLAGTWRDTRDGSVWEEHWLPPRGDSMAAVTRCVKKGRTTLFELSAIERGEKETTLTLRHFGKRLKPSEEASLVFRLVSHENRTATFENAEKDFPHRILYRRRDDDHLDVTLENRQGSYAFTFLFERVK
jgi:hypothetical protein